MVVVLGRVVLVGSQIRATWKPDYTAAQHAALMAALKIGGIAIFLAAVAAALEGISAAVAAGSVGAWLSFVLSWLGLAADVLVAHIETVVGTLVVLALALTGIAAALYAESTNSQAWYSNRFDITDYMGTMVRGIGFVTALAATAFTSVLAFQKWIPAPIFDSLMAGPIVSLGAIALVGTSAGYIVGQAEQDQLYYMFGD